MFMRVVDTGKWIWERDEAVRQVFKRDFRSRLRGLGVACLLLCLRRAWSLIDFPRYSDTQLMMNPIWALGLQ